jgi:hypothetical protein
VGCVRHDGLCLQAVLHCRNLPEGTTQRDLLAAFSPFAKVAEAVMMTSRNQASVGSTVVALGLWALVPAHGLWMRHCHATACILHFVFVGFCLYGMALAGVSVPPLACCCCCCCPPLDRVW